MSNLRKEIKRSIKNKFFYISCIIGIILSLICVFEAVKDYSDYAVSLEEVEMINLNPLVPTLSAYTLWIGGGESNLYSTMMFLMLPLLVSLPYAWSYCSDRKNGYLKKAVKEIGSLKYNLSKYVATFISSGLVGLSQIMCKPKIMVQKKRIKFMMQSAIHSPAVLAI